MVYRIFLSAFLAGVISGGLFTGLQQIAVVPMILEAETYEQVSNAVQSQTGGRPGTAAIWTTGKGRERLTSTALANILTAIGFGLLLTACYALQGTINWLHGLYWGLAGFGVFCLAPALGLAPELPGAAAADIDARQAWWLLTVVLTASGLGMMIWAPGFRWRSCGLFLLLVPHVVGAPQPGMHNGLAPVELARAFVYASLITSAVFWAMLGVFTGFFFERLGTGAEANQLPAFRA